MLLQVAAFGERDILSLPWITPPSAGSVGKAQHLLKLLGAVDADGKLTAIGKQMAAMPCHPRVARMILGCRTKEMRSLACDIAAILEEKDPLTAEESADITIRIGVLRSCRSKRNVGRWQRIADGGGHSRTYHSRCQTTDGVSRLTYLADGICQKSDVELCAQGIQDRTDQKRTEQTLRHGSQRIDTVAFG